MKTALGLSERTDEECGAVLQINRLVWLKNITSNLASHFEMAETPQTTNQPENLLKYWGQNKTTAIS